MVIYNDENADKKNSVLRYIGNRVLNSNKNFLCAVTGGVGMGKSYACLRMAEDYSKMFDIEFNPKYHVIDSLKELLKLITAPEKERKIRVGSVIVFDEPQVEGNSRSWQSDINKAMGQLISTFRNQRLVVFFALPFLDMLDRQTRIIFQGEFKVEGYDRNTKITTIKPRFLEFNKTKKDFYRKMLLVRFKVKGKKVMITTKLNKWHIPITSKEIIDVYEAKKQHFTDELNKKLLAQIELNEQKMEGRNKSDELFKVANLFERYGEDYMTILEHMPHLTPFQLEKYLLFVKKSKKLREKSNKTA
jgi:hypothetical protein